METPNKNEPNESNELDNETVAILMRQTTYTREEALISLKENGSIEKCISKYLGIKPKIEQEMSNNQKIFKSIREFI